MEDNEFIIEINNLKFAYPSYKGLEKSPNVLDSLNLKVRKGEFLSIMGPTGAGKTTLCLALNGIIPHSIGGRFGGEILVCGVNTKETSMSELAKKVGIVFQDPESQLFSMTIEDEVAFGLENMGISKDAMNSKVKEALKAVGMENFGDRSPFHLSGGQKQRVAIAAMLAMEPEILILDEPTSGLDPIGKREVFQVVDNLRKEKNMTIIMIEQESERIADFSDRVVILNNGKIELEGTPDEVFRNVEVLRKIGVSIPQVAELSYDYRKRYNEKECEFIRLNEAEKYFVERM